MITYTTKAWEGDYTTVLGYHPDAELILGNNMFLDTQNKATQLFGKRFKYVGEGHPYTISEMYAAQNTKSKYLLWYAPDVTPPSGDWVTKALPLLDEYVAVSPFWREPYGSYVDLAKRQEIGGFKETDFGFEDHLFTDHAFIAKSDVMKAVDFEATSYVSKYYPPHGGNSFECRMAQYLESSNQRRGVLKDFSYAHTTTGEKNA